MTQIGSQQAATVTDRAAVRRVLCVVAGGSLVGLSAAIALSRAGIDVTVLERSPARAVAGGGAWAWTSPDDDATVAGSAWAPFRHEAFAALWGAQFISNIGSWMQTVGAQWLMLALTGSTAYVALIQTAASLPIVLFAVLAGALGDLVDRRKFLLITQVLMLVAAAALGVLAIEGLVTPWVLLALIFAVGTGQALTSPTWQTLQPELVSPEERPQAISLGAVNQNLARAVGPAIGGIILAATSAGTVFLINAATFLAVLGVLVWWRGSRGRSAGTPCRVSASARRSGRRPVRQRQPGPAGHPAAGRRCSSSSPARSGPSCR